MKIVIIGAASASFGTGNLGSIMECKQSLRSSLSRDSLTLTLPIFGQL